MNASVRTPSQVIALVLEEEGFGNNDAKVVSEEIAQRLGIAMRSVSKPNAKVVIQGTPDGIEWATVQIFVQE